VTPHRPGQSDIEGNMTVIQILSCVEVIRRVVARMELSC
jgi:hypothetical protein